MKCLSSTWYGVRPIKLTLWNSTGFFLSGLYKKILISIILIIEQSLQSVPQIFWIKSISQRICKSWQKRCTYCMIRYSLSIADYGRPMKSFFIEIPNLCAWADNLSRYIFGHFQPIYQHPFWYSESQIFVWDWDLNLGRKELGIQPSCGCSLCIGQQKNSHMVCLIYQILQ